MKSLKLWLTKLQLRNLKTANVVYTPEKEEITITKGKINISLKATLVLQDSQYFMRISGHPIVLDNRVMQSVWEVLWNAIIPLPTDGKSDTNAVISSSEITDQPTGVEENGITFGEVTIWADPTFLKIRKDEVVPMLYVKQPR